MSKRWIDGRMVEIPDTNIQAVLRKLHGEPEPKPTNAYVRQFVQRIDGEDYPVLFVDSSAEAPGDGEEAVCEGCGREVNVFMVSDPDSSEEPYVAECLPCFFRGDFESVKPR